MCGAARLRRRFVSSRTHDEYAGRQYLTAPPVPAEVIVNVLERWSTAAIIVVGLSCAAPGMRGTADPCAEVNVPLEPPDTVPTWFQDDSSFSESPPHLLKHIIVVMFQPGTPAADRQSAINRVCGQVVGGWRSQLPERNAYAVQVPDGGDERRLDEMVEELRKLPQIRSAASTVRRWPQ
jgi:hypothetical protein